MRTGPGVGVSFEDFVRARSGALFRTALLLTGQDRAEAEDLLQGALERAYRHWGRICRHGDPERYVRRILANASTDRWRRLVRRPEHELPGDGGGTVLTTCAGEIGMPLPLGWRASSIQAGPFWFVNLRQATATYYGHRDVAISGLAVSVLNGVTASVRVVGPAVGHFRFLFRPRDFSQGVGGRYTMKSGENGVTFAGCTPGSAWAGERVSYQPGYTQFGGYYIVDTVPRQVSLEIRSSAASRPKRITFLVGY